MFEKLFNGGDGLARIVPLDSDLHLFAISRRQQHQFKTTLTIADIVALFDCNVRFELRCRTGDEMCGAQVKPEFVANDKGPLDR